MVKIAPVRLIGRDKEQGRCCPDHPPLTYPPSFPGSYIADLIFIPTFCIPASFHPLSQTKVRYNILHTGNHSIILKKFNYDFDSAQHPEVYTGKNGS